MHAHEPRLNTACRFLRACKNPEKKFLKRTRLMRTDELHVVRMAETLK
jgi:hypothetical protein